MDIANSTARQSDYLKQVSLRLPYACRQGMTSLDATPDCHLCWQTIIEGSCPGDDGEADAVGLALDRLAARDCDGAAQLRRDEALRQLDATVRAWWWKS